MKTRGLRNTVVDNARRKTATEKKNPSLRRASGVFGVEFEDVILDAHTTGTEPKHTTAAPDAAQPQSNMFARESSDSVSSELACVVFSGVAFS